MSRILAGLKRRPLALLGGAFALLWLVYVGAALRPRFGLPPLDTSRPVLVSRGDDTTLVQTTFDGQVHTTAKTIGPVVPWKNGLVYWDRMKPCLFFVAPGKKARAIWLRPSVPQLSVEFITPAADGVYLNGNAQSANVNVYHVRLPDGVVKTLPGVEEIKGSETNAAYACLKRSTTSGVGGVAVVKYANGGRRTVSLGGNTYLSSWDYDAARDAVVWIDSGAVHYDSPACSWHKTFDIPYSVGCNARTGDVWVQTYGSFGGRGMAVLSSTGIERGWRWKGETLSAEHTAELTPEQAKLFRALPSYK